MAENIHAAVKQLEALSTEYDPSPVALASAQAECLD
jgi:hypothetical protein